MRCSAIGNRFSSCYHYQYHSLFINRRGPFFTSEESKYTLVELFVSRTWIIVGNVCVIHGLRVIGSSAITEAILKVNLFLFSLVLPVIYLLKYINK